jgi:hypothetical protein
MDATALHVMLVDASARLADCHERGDEPHYREIADEAVRRYLAACTVPVRMSAEQRAGYAHQIVRHLLAKDARE